MTDFNLDSVESFARYFNGRWNTDRSYSNGSHLTGTADFRPVGTNYCSYKEVGQLHLNNGYVSECFRNYFFEFHGKGFSIYFDEDRKNLFQNCSFQVIKGQLQAQGQHLCFNDVYGSQYKIWGCPS